MLLPSRLIWSKWLTSWLSYSPLEPFNRLICCNKSRVVKVQVSLHVLSLLSCLVFLPSIRKSHETDQKCFFSPCIFSSVWVSANTSRCACLSSRSHPGDVVFHREPFDYGLAEDQSWFVNLSAKISSFSRANTKKHVGDVNLGSAFPHRHTDENPLLS